MREIRETKAVKQTLALAELLLTGENAVGEVVGAAGTGKSMAGRAVVQRLGALRVVAYEGMTRRQMLLAIAQQIGIEGVGSAERVLNRSGADRVLLVVDEANKLSWRVLETLRYLADECALAVLLIGTELYSRKFSDAHTKPLLMQLGSRIGAKPVA